MQLVVLFDYCWEVEESQTRLRDFLINTHCKVQSTKDQQMQLHILGKGGESILNINGSV